MTRTHYHASSENGAISLAVCIRVNSDFNTSDINKLADMFTVLRRRFAANILLGLEGMEPLDEEILSQWLADGLIELTICSGHEYLILNDLIDAAIRSTAISSVFVDAVDLLCSPARALKFIVECLGVVSGTAMENNGKLFQAGKQELQTFSRMNLAGRWHDGLRNLSVAFKTDLGEESERTDKTLVKDGVEHNLSPRHLFVTQAGVDRLGGIEKFRTLPIRLGGALLSEFTNITILTLGDSSNEGGPSFKFKSCKKLSAFLSTASQIESVVFDIWPAPHKFMEPSHQDQIGHINVPRQILVGRRCPVRANAALCTVSPCRAVFIMSNFNKAPYLYAALYGWVMQAHPTIQLEIVDDISTDSSVKMIRLFQQLTGLSDSMLQVRSNERRRGTYWIRNSIIHRHMDDDVVFFINDSDDVSSALRTTLQILILASEADQLACLFNIVRVDKNYSPLPLNGEVERYGTASLCFKTELIRRAGYFQNLKKNADTEFIRRIKRFLGSTATLWIKHSVMFQPFDGSNLTSDIYKIRQGGGRISANLDSRKLHIEIADRHHTRLTLADLPNSFGFPVFSLPSDYAQLGKEFLIDP